MGRARRTGCVGLGQVRSVVSMSTPGLLVALDLLVEPESRGDPMAPLRWTLKSTRVLSRLGHQAGANLVGELLHHLGYSLQANAKVTKGSQHPDRDAQFRYINDTATQHLEAGEPVISVDCKKKELVGDYANGGAEWELEGEPTKVGVHDFPDPEMGKAIPYGVYDIGGNEGWANVGDDHDTPAFVVASIARWWQRMGAARYPNATSVVITAGAGGSNSYRTVVELIATAATTTTTTTGLRVAADLDQGYYPTGQKISNADFTALPVTRHDFHGDWNYTVRPS